MLPLTSSAMCKSIYLKAILFFFPKTVQLVQECIKCQSVNFIVLSAVMKVAVAVCSDKV